MLSSDQMTDIKERTLSLMQELHPDLIPLTKVPEIYEYNIFFKEDFYERFLGVLSQANGAFSKATNWQECLVDEPTVSLQEKFKI